MPEMNKRCFGYPCDFMIECSNYLECMIPFPANKTKTNKMNHDLQFACV